MKIKRYFYVDYKSVCNVTKHCLNRASALLFWEAIKVVSREICDKQHQPPIVNYTPTTCQWEIQNSIFGTPVDCFFPTFKGSKHGSSYRG